MKHKTSTPTSEERKTLSGLPIDDRISEKFLPSRQKEKLKGKSRQEFPKSHGDALCAYPNILLLDIGFSSNDNNLSSPIHMYY